MSRTNLILLALVAVAGGVYLLLDRSDPLAGKGPAQRLFPEFNKETAERIVLSGGWKGTEYVFERRSSNWSLTLPGASEGYPVKSEEAANFIDAIANLRRENPAGDSDELAQQTLAGEPYGRLVQVFAGNKATAAFRVGKNPKQAWDHFFIRREDEKAIYRTRTLLTKDRDKGPDTSSPFGGGVRGWDWKNYTGDASRWFDTQIWSLGSAEVVEIKLHRADLDVALVRLADEKWEVRPSGEGQEPFPADTAAVDDIKSRVNYLSFEEVVGGTGDEAVLKEYGLDQPEITLVLKLKKKIEKKQEEPAPGEEPTKEGEEKKPEEPEYKELDATITVGKKIKVKERFEEEEKKVTEEEYYAIRVAGNHWENAEHEKRENFIFLVSDYKVASLRKSLDELRRKAEAKPEGEGEGAPGEGCGCGEKKTDGCGTDEEACGCEEPEPGCGCGSTEPDDG